MLSIYYGNMPEAIYNTAVYFNNTYQESWLKDELAQQMIKSVDKSIVIGGRLIDSKALDLIPPTGLSGGVKTLLLIQNEPDKIFNASTCGNNCARWILKLAKTQDITINLRHMMDFGGRRFTARILNTGDVVHSMKELAPIAGDFLGSDMR